MSAEPTVAVNIEIAAAQFSGRQRGLRLEDAILCMNDEHDRPPGGQISSDCLEPNARDGKRRSGPQTIENVAQGRMMTARDLIENAVGLRL
jgi:hypothetical protein